MIYMTKRVEATDNRPSPRFRRWKAGTPLQAVITCLASKLQSDWKYQLSAVSLYVRTWAKANSLYPPFIRRSFPSWTAAGTPHLRQEHFHPSVLHVSMFHLLPSHRPPENVFKLFKISFKSSQKPNFLFLISNCFTTRSLVPATFKTLHNVRSQQNRFLIRSRRSSRRQRFSWSSSSGRGSGPRSNSVPIDCQRSQAPRISARLCKPVPCRRCSWQWLWRVSQSSWFSKLILIQSFTIFSTDLNCMCASSALQDAARQCIQTQCPDSGLKNADTLKSQLCQN